MSESMKTIPLSSHGGHWLNDEDFADIYDVLDTWPDAIVEVDMTNRAGQPIGAAVCYRAVGSNRTIVLEPDTSARALITHTGITWHPSH